MNILVVSEYFYPRLAGAELVLWELCTALMKKGHKIYAVTSKTDDTSEYDVIEEVEIYRPFVTGRSSLTRLVFAFKLYFYLKQFLKLKSVDVIYNLAYIPTLPVTYLAVKKGIPVVTGVHSFVGAGWFSLINPISAAINYLLEMFILRFGRHNALQFPSLNSRMIAAPYFRAAGVTIYNPIAIDEMERIKQQTSGPQVRESLGVSRDDLFLLFVGSLIPAKNVTGLVTCLRHLKKNFKLVIIGEGPERKKIGQLVTGYGLKGKVMMLGQKPRQETLSIIAACDVLILPSKSEQFPNVVLEGLAMGKPVIATKVGGIPEIKSANLHLIDNLEEICQVLDSGIKAQEDDSVVEEYSLDRVAGEYERLLQGLVKVGR